MILISLCDFDAEDCCFMDNDRSQCTNCTCFVSTAKIHLYQEQNCQNALNLYFFLGDAICDLSYNTAEYFFDIGDCCQDDIFACTEQTFLYTVLDSMSEECPHDSCIESNNYCIADELGDGICQDHNNGPHCDYDLGDCCASDEQEQCCYCACHSYQHSFYFLG